MARPADAALSCQLARLLLSRPGCPAQAHEPRPIDRAFGSLEVVVCVPSCQDEGPRPDDELDGREGTQLSAFRHNLLLQWAGRVVRRRLRYVAVPDTAVEEGVSERSVPNDRCLVDVIGKSSDLSGPDRLDLMLPGRQWDRRWLQLGDAEKVRLLPGCVTSFEILDERPQRLMFSRNRVGDDVQADRLLLQEDDLSLI